MPDPQEPSKSRRFRGRIDVHGLRTEFLMPFEASQALGRDLKRLLQKYEDDIEYVQAEKPPRIRNRPDGQQVVVRKALLDLKAKGLIPPMIDATIPWRYAPDDRLGERPTLPQRGPSRKDTQRAYWDCVDMGLIDSDLPRPEEYVVRYHGRRS